MPPGASPHNLDPQLHEAIASHRAGHLSHAESLYRAILHVQPDNGDALHLLGVIGFQCGHYEAAITLIRRALAVQPDNPFSHNDLGNALRAAGMLDEAIASYGHAARIDASYADVHCNLGEAYRLAGRFDDAVASHREALRLRPDSAAAHNNLGMALVGLGQRDQAKECYRHALQLNPELYEAHNNLGLTFYEDGMLDDAAACYRQALLLHPAYADAINNLGSVLRDQGDVAGAIALFRRATALAPNSAEAHDNLGQALLLSGAFAEGWREREWRWLRADFAAQRRRFGCPVWDGTADIAGRTILIHAEQGLGDTLQFVRYLPMVAARGARVILACQPQLRDLLATSFPNYQVRTDLPPENEFDLHCPLLSLPLAFRTTQQSVPRDVPYLRVDKAMLTSETLGDSGKRGALQVGIVWAGNPRHARDRYRSVPLAQFGRLCDVPGVVLHSLQVGPRAHEASLLGLTDSSSQGKDFSRTAEIIAGLDLLISVDSAPAHLAGAMGKPVWALIPFAPDWRWLVTGDSTPWYPTMRLFRQTVRGDWQPVLDRVVRELRDARPV